MDDEKKEGRQTYSFAEVLRQSVILLPALHALQSSVFQRLLPRFLLLLLRGYNDRDFLWNGDFIGFGGCFAAAGYILSHDRHV